MVGGSKPTVPFTTSPNFLDNANKVATALESYSAEELKEILKVNPIIAKENFLRYKNFTKSELSSPALFSYTGAVFKSMAPNEFSQDELEYAQEHLRITSFCYGLLRPLDLINPYRLEGGVVLPEFGESMFDYWKPILTDHFIADIKAHGGVLCNLASGEMKRLFDWKRVAKEVEIVTPEFKTYKNGKLTTIVMYAKMARGEATKYIIKNRVSNPDIIREMFDCV